jgi:hypothetical protein
MEQSWTRISQGNGTPAALFANALFDLYTRCRRMYAPVRRQSKRRTSAIVLNEPQRTLNSSTWALGGEHAKSTCSPIAMVESCTRSCPTCVGGFRSGKAVETCECLGAPDPKKSLRANENTKRRHRKNAYGRRNVKQKVK